MHPRISEALDYVEKQTANLHVAYESVPAEQRGVRKDPSRWSPAEVVRHVAMVERRLAKLLTVLVEQARALPPETETTSAMTSQSTTKAFDRTDRFVTADATEPRDSDPTRVWDDLMDARQEIVRVINTGDGLALGAVSIAHPFLGGLNGYEWIAFVGSHAARHADQIREMNLAR